MSTPTALLVGGTGPTGPHLLDGLLERGFDVAMFHTGRHEPDGLPDVEHVHGDPFTAEGIAAALGDRAFDVTVATYGRVRLLAAHLAHRTGQLVAVGGVPVYRGYAYPQTMRPTGMRLPVTEDHPLVAPDEPTPEGGAYGVAPIRRTEDALFALAADGAFRATVFRYPTIYGPRNPHPWEWSVVKRVLDGRPWMIVPDDGRSVYARCAARNAAHGLLLAVDRPEVADGKGYNVADERVLSQRQWAELIVDLMGGTLEVRSLPGEIPSPGLALTPYRNTLTAHSFMDLRRIREDLGYTPVIEVEDALRETVDHWVAHADEMAAHPHQLDPFDYAAEDRLMAAWERALVDLREAGAAFAEVRTMPTPQTAKGTSAVRA